MAVCQIQPKPDMYGLGIRVAFYVQWFGAILIAYIDETQLDDVRFLGLFLSAGATVALIVQVAGSKLQAADIYIVLLLAAGIYIFLVPVYIWRGLTLCNPYWNPLRWSKEKPSPMFRVLSFTLLVVVASVGTWYWTTFLPGVHEGCTQFGYFFGRVSLGNTVYIAFNAMLYVVILLVCVVVLFIKAGWEAQVWLRERRKRKAHSMHKEILRVMRTGFFLAVFASLVAAIELTISWNEIEGVHDIGPVGQMIPLFVSAGFVLRSFVLMLVTGDDDSSSGHSVRVHATERKTTYRRTVVEEEVSGGPNWPPPPPAAARKR